MCVCVCVCVQMKEVFGRRQYLLLRQNMNKLPHSLTIGCLLSNTLFAPRAVMGEAGATGGVTVTAVTRGTLGWLLEREGTVGNFMRD